MSGTRVLIPGLIDAIEAGTVCAARGVDAVVAPVLRVVPAAGEELAALRAELAEGGFDLLLVTSATTVDALAEHGLAVPPSTRVAAVGTRTAERLAAIGVRVDHVPAESSAHGLLEDPAIAPAGSVLRIALPQSALADPVLATALSERGHLVRAVTAYAIEELALPGPVVSDMLGGGIQAVLLASGSAARALHTQLGDGLAAVPLVAIGPSTERVLDELGLPVAAVAQERSLGGMLDALEAVSVLLAAPGLQTPEGER